MKAFLAGKNDDSFRQVMAWQNGTVSVYSARKLLDVTWQADDGTSVSVELTKAEAKDLVQLLGSFLGEQNDSNTTLFDSSDTADWA